MAVDIGPKIGIDGEREFRQQIQQTNQALKTLAAEGKAVTSAFDAETDAEKRSAAQKDVLARKIETQKDKLALLERGLKESAQMYGESDTRTMKWQQAVHEATAELNDMEGQLRDVDKEVDETGDSMEEAGEKTKGWADVMKGSLLADAVKSGLKKAVDLAKDAAKAMWDMVAGGAAYADDINQMASVTGLSTDKLQEYKYMADLIDVSLDTLTGSMSKMTKSMSNAKDGTGDAAKAWKDLGVSIKDSNGNLRKAEDVFNDTIDALGKIDNETERDAMAMRIFGKSAQDLNPLIKAGGKEINKLAKEAHDTGNVLSGSALKAMNKQQDAMDRLGKKAEGLKNRFSAGLAPSIENAANKMGEAFDNPVVKRGMDNLANTIGGIIDDCVGFIADVLPDIVRFFSSDPAILLLSERELELVQNTEDAAKAYEDLVNTYNENAGAIMTERERVEDLWKELQKLTDENGYVKDANKERADFIIHELNDALGTEYELNGNIITQYGEMKQELGDLIKMREAEALLGAYKDRYETAIQNRDSALLTAGSFTQKIADAKKEMEDLAKEVEALDEAWRKANPGGQVTAYGTRYSRDATTVTDKNYREAVQRYEMLLGYQENARSTLTKTYADIERYEKARAAYLAGNYELATFYLADEAGATLRYYAQKKELTKQEQADLKLKIAEAKVKYDEYYKHLSEGAAGFTEDGLAELQHYIDNAEKLLDGQHVAELFVQGLINGLNARRQDVYNASRNVALSVTKAVKQTLDIQSPSRVGDWIGQMWDAGLVNGLEAREDEIARSASNLADTIVTSSTPSGALDIAYGNALTASGAGPYASSSYTTNMGGIAVYVNGAGAVNEDELAKRIAVQLTDELTRAQRGGRR